MYQFTKKGSASGGRCSPGAMGQWHIKLGGHGVTAPFARQHKYLWFSAFPNFRKVGKFAASIERPKTKSVLALGDP